MSDQAAMITPTNDFLTLAKTIQPKRKASVLKAREHYEQHYVRT